MRLKKLISAVAAVVISCSAFASITAMAEYSATESGTLTWTFKNTDETIELTDGLEYYGITLYGSGTLNSESKNGLGLKKNGNYITYTPSVSGELTITTKHPNKAELYVDTDWEKNTDDDLVADKNNTGEQRDFYVINADLVAGTQYYIYSGASNTTYIYSMTFTPKAVDTKWNLSRMGTAIEVPANGKYNYNGLVLGNKHPSDPITIAAGNDGKNGYAITQKNGGYVQYTPLADGTLTFKLKNVDLAEAHFGTAYNKNEDPEITAENNDEMTVTQDVTAGEIYYLYNGAKSDNLYVLSVEYKVAVEEPTPTPIPLPEAVEADREDAIEFATEGSEGASLWKATIVGTGATYNTITATVKAGDAEKTGTANTTNITTTGNVDVFVVVNKLITDISSVKVSVSSVPVE